MNQLQVPSKIKTIIGTKAYKVDGIGMSGNQVLIFEDMVLKIEDSSEAIRKQVEVMKWLDGKIPAPKVLEYEEENGKSYLLMSKIDGEMACDTYYLEHPQMLLKALADGLKMLWRVDFSECPAVRDLDVLLKEARFQVENDLVDVENVEPDTFGENGFESPMHLLTWLENNRPSFEPVFSHGDYCLPNIMLDDWRFSGFIDLGNGGAGDRHVDLFWGMWSLQFNLKTDQYAERFLDAYGRDKVTPELFRTVAAIEVFG